MWFKCPRCGEQVEQGQIPELKGFVSHGKAIAYEFVGIAAGMALGVAICVLVVALIM